MKLGNKIWEEDIHTPGHEDVTEAWQRLYGVQLDVTVLRRHWSRLESTQWFYEPEAIIAQSSATGSYAIFDWPDDVKETCGRELWSGPKTEVAMAWKALFRVGMPDPKNSHGQTQILDETNTDVSRRGTFLYDRFDDGILRRQLGSDVVKIYRLGDSLYQVGQVSSGKRPVPHDRVLDRDGIRSVGDAILRGVMDKWIRVKRLVEMSADGSREIHNYGPYDVQVGATSEVNLGRWDGESYQPYWHVIPHPRHGFPTPDSNHSYYAMCTERWRDGRWSLEFSLDIDENDGGDL